MSEWEASRAARTGQERETFPLSTDRDVEEALAAATGAAAEVGGVAPSVRATWLEALAAALDEPATVARLVELADAESGLGEARLTGELARTASQLRFYAAVAVEGSWLGATIDHATSTSPDLRRVNVPLGVVAALGASNFPFAFGVLGNDTASALAAGCPVVAKGHPAHPATSRALAQVAEVALREAGAPRGVFALVTGFAAGERLVQAPQVRALAFTGSQAGGLALWRAANDREGVIPVYAEMGTVNPVVVTRGAVAAGSETVGRIAEGFVGSFTLGTGQFCTKPGLLLAPAGAGVIDAVGDALDAAAPSGWLLTSGIRDSLARGLEEMTQDGAQIVRRVDSTEPGWSAGATLLTAPLEALRPGSRLLEETFGPVALVVEYGPDDDPAEVLGRLQGSLTATVATGGVHDGEAARLVDTLSRQVGRVAVDDWPTGVAWTWAQHHGGPWPATSNPGTTSVGAAALGRFVRPVAHQSSFELALPAALREDNPWGLPRRIDGRPVPAPDRGAVAHRGAVS